MKTLKKKYCLRRQAQGLLHDNATITNEGYPKIYVMEQNKYKECEINTVNTISNHTIT